MIADIDGLVLHYEVYGDGTPAVCIHGWNENGKVFKTIAYKKLLREYKIYALDLPGFGDSCSLEEYNFEKLTKVIDKFAVLMKLEQFCMVGQCMGGIIALDYAIRYKEKVNKLFLIETMIYFPFWMNLLLFEFLTVNMLKFMLSKKLSLKLMGVHKAFRNSSKNAKLTKMLKKVNVKHSVQYIKMMKSYSKIDHIERAKVLWNVPVKVIISENTFKEIRKTANDINRALNNVSLVIVPKKNHFIFFE